MAALCRLSIDPFRAVSSDHVGGLENMGKHGPEPEVSRVFIPTAADNWFGARVNYFHVLMRYIGRYFSRCRIGGVATKGGRGS